jgi:hypothetical protein
MAEVKEELAAEDNLFFAVLLCAFVDELSGTSTAATKVLSCVKTYQNQEARPLKRTASSSCYISVYQN